MSSSASGEIGLMVLHHPDHSLVRVWGFDIDIKILDSELIWNLKVKLQPFTNFLPHKQMLFFKGEKKEIDSSLKAKDLKRGDKKPQRLLVLKSRELNKKKKEKFQMFGKKFKEEISLPFCFVTGRVKKGVVGIPSDFCLHAISKDFQPVSSKDATVFDVFIQSPGDPDFETPTFNSKIDSQGEMIRYSWVPPSAGKYSMIIKSGDTPICGSPFQVEIIDHKHNGAIVKQLAYDKEWNVEAAKIIVDWTHKEEYDKVIFNEIGLETILGLLKSEPQHEIVPCIVEALNHLLLKDVMKNHFVSNGLSTLLELVKLGKDTHSPSINHFSSRCLASVGYIAVVYHDKNPKESQFSKDYFIGCNLKFFEMIESWLQTLLPSEEETKRNIMRALSYFSCSKTYIPMIADANLFGDISESSDNPEVEIATRRFAISTIANFSEVQDSNFRRRFFTDARVCKLLSLAKLPYTEDKLVSESVRALANLSATESYSDLILSQHSSDIGLILKSIAGTDLITNWETQLHNLFIPDPNERTQLKTNYVKFSRNDDIFSIHCMKLISNLLMNNTHGSELAKMTVRFSAIRTFVLVIRSCNLTLQSLACKVIAALSVHSDCQEEIIKVGGLIALCYALNTCDAKATPHIVAALANMPLNIKNTLASIIGDSGLNKLLDLLKQPENKQLQRDTAILLSSLAGNDDDSKKILAEGGAHFLRNLIELVKKQEVNIHIQVNPKEIQKIKIIGKGISGTVWESIWRGRKVAVKVIDEEGLAFNEEEFQSEVALMTIMRHENVVSCIGSSTIPGNLFIISELLERGSLETLINDDDVQITVQLAVHLALGAARGMKYLHMLGLIHRDLKSGNLLVNNEFVAKVADFGLSRMMDKTMTRGVGTPIYTAPETLKGSQYSQKADVYSFAFILYELVTRKIPYDGISPWEVARKVCDEGLRPDIPPNCIFEGLMQQCWNGDPKLRPDFTEIVEVLNQLQKLVGPYNSYEDTISEEEEAKYNYERASEILTRTLRGGTHRNSNASSNPIANPIPLNQSMNAAPNLIVSPLQASGFLPSTPTLLSDFSSTNIIECKNSPSSTSARRLRLSSRNSAELKHNLVDPNTNNNNNNNNTEDVKQEEEVPSQTRPSKRVPTGKFKQKSNMTTLRKKSSEDLEQPTSGEAKTRIRRSKDELPSPGAQRKNSENSKLKSSSKPEKPQENSFSPTESPELKESRERSDSKKVIIDPCGRCGQSLMGSKLTFVIDNKQTTWHPACFTCFRCNSPLRDYYVNDGQVYCEKDYREHYSPKCGGCNLSVGANYVSALNKEWHPGCLVCSRCKGELGDEFSIEDNAPLCDACCNY